MIIVIALLLQSLVVLPDRMHLENPAISRQIPKQLQKDYDKLWARFQTGREDAKVLSDATRLLKKDAEFVPALLIQAWIHHYSGQGSEAEKLFQRVLRFQPLNPEALHYIAETSFNRGDYLRAGNLYRSLMAIEPASPELEMKAQKALLLAVQDLIAGAQEALRGERWADAENLFREALELAPEQAALHGLLAQALAGAGEWDQAAGEYRRQIELGDPAPEARAGLSEALSHLGRTSEASTDTDGGATTQADRELAELGRWGTEIERFRAMAAAPAVTREELASLIARYFPQIHELRKDPQIVTDTQGSWASSDIHAVLGVGILDPMPNHTFRPGKIVTRGEFARALARLSRVLGVFPEGEVLAARSNQASSDTLDADLRLVADLGLLASADPHSIDLSANLSGEEAVNAAEKLLHRIEKSAF